MVNFLTSGPAFWTETALKNQNNPNSAEPGRARYYSNTCVGFIELAPYAASRTRAVFMAGRSLVGFMAHGFVDDFYNRIHLSPRTIEAGLLSNETAYVITLWNAYITETVAISAINLSDSAGITLDKTPPLALLPLTDLTLNLTLTMDGPPTQATGVVFVTTAGDLTLNVSASRVLRFPFEPDWQSGFTFGITCANIITQLGRRYEQRRAVTSQPAFTISFTAWYPRQKGRELSDLLENAFDRVLALPLFCFGECVAGTPTANSLKLKPFSNNWFMVRRAQMLVAFDYQNDRQQVLNISDMDAATGLINLVQDITLARVDAVFPGLPSYLESYSLTQVTSALSQVKLNFKGYADGNGALNNVPALPAAWPFTFNFENGLSQSFETTRSLTNFDGGVTALSSLIDYALTTISGDVVSFNKTDEFALLDFFVAAHGRQAAFSYHSPVAMFEAARDYLAGQTTISVLGTDAATALDRIGPLTLWYRDKTGTTATVTVTGVEATASGRTLYFSAPFPYAIKKGGLLGRIYTMRLDQDVLELNYTTSAVAEANITLKEVMA